MQISRRHFIVSSAAVSLALPQTTLAQQPPLFTFETVKDKAADLAKQAYQNPKSDLPQVLKDLDYSHFRLVNFKAEQAVWRDNGLFRLQLYHRGFQFDRKVTINTVENGRASEVIYSPDLFDFRTNNFKTDFSPDLGFSGFRLHFPLNRTDYFDEFAVFQGASYYRLIGRGQVYGLSCRGLAIDTAGPKGEEFPYFTEFWLERPAPTANWIVVYALLDSPSVTGAYRFVLVPESQTIVRVSMQLYPRVDITKLGVAPLTSMFLHGKPGNRTFADLRPEVHDSDGLMLHNGSGEWLWRPLTDPRSLQITSFADNTPKGFGLMQRERDIQRYQDLEANYHLRPSAWIEPDGDWGRGGVELVEIPSDEEINDNIVSYWVPQTPVKAKETVNLSYKITMLLHDQRLFSMARCVSTRTAPLVPVEIQREDRHGPHRISVEFTGGEISSLSAQMALDAMFTASSGKIDDAACQKIGPDNWRAIFTFTPDGGNDADLRGYISLRGSPMTETWTYHWSGA